MVLWMGIKSMPAEGIDKSIDIHDQRGDEIK